MQTKAIKDIKSYCQSLQNDYSERQALIASLSIHLSYFMRDKKAFDALERFILVPLIEKYRLLNNKKITIWSAGCSSGEEPYSLAILLTKLIGKELNNWEIELDATDSNEHLIQQAAMAKYRKVSFQKLDADYIPDFFTLVNDTYYLKPSIRAMVSLHLRDILHAPANLLYDVILCRNVLVYYTKRQQLNMVKHIINYLKPEGYFMLGMAETMPEDAKHMLAPVSMNYRIYQRLPAAGGSNASKSFSIRRTKPE